MHGTKIFILLLFMTSIVSPTYAMNLTLTPENPFVGDNITLKGDTTPNQKSIVSITLEKKMNISGRGGLLYYQLPDINIPSGENKFRIIGYNVSRLYVGVGHPVYWYRDAAGYRGYAELSWSNVPSGKYYITISANALYNNMEEIRLYLSAEIEIKSNERGNLNYTYSTSGFPAGTYVLYVRDMYYPITLSERPAPGISRAPTAVQTVNEVASTPVPIQVTANITTVAETTLDHDRTVVITSTPLATLTESKPIPGFEFALLGPIAILYFMKRRFLGA